MIKYLSNTKNCFIYKFKIFLQIADVRIYNLKSSDNELLVDVIQNISGRLILFFTDDLNKYEVKGVLKNIETNEVRFSPIKKSLK